MGAPMLPTPVNSQIQAKLSLYCNCNTLSLLSLTDFQMSTSILLRLFVTHIGGTLGNSSQTLILETSVMTQKPLENMSMFIEQLVSSAILMLNQGLVPDIRIRHELNRSLQKKWYMMTLSIQGLVPGIRIRQEPKQSQQRNVMMTSLRQGLVPDIRIRHVTLKGSQRRDITLWLIGINAASYRKTSASQLYMSNE